MDVILNVSNGVPKPEILRQTVKLPIDINKPDQTGVLRWVKLLLQWVTLLLSWLSCFCHERFALAVSDLLLPWLSCFCHERFALAVSDLLLSWQLWATVMFPCQFFSEFYFAGHWSQQSTCRMSAFCNTVQFLFTYDTDRYIWFPSMSGILHFFQIKAPVTDCRNKEDRDCL